MSHMQSETDSKPRTTWVEIAIVTVVLVVLAALVVPPFSEAGMDPQTKELRSAVQIVRGQIDMYRLQHDNQYPTLKQFVAQMTLATNSRGEVAGSGAGEQAAAATSDGFAFGPYLRSVPANPYLGTNSISAERDGTIAWFYDEKTGEFRANHPDASPGR
jgi:competence protein ComGC